MQRFRTFLVAATAATLLAARTPRAGESLLGELGNDLDGDGQTERITVDAGGVLRVTGAAGQSWGEVRPGDAVPAARLNRSAPALLDVVRAAGRVWVHARVPLVADRERKPGAAAQLELLGLIEDHTLRSVYADITGPQGPDDEWSKNLLVDERGALLFQRASGIARCDGSDLLYPSLYDLQTGRFRLVSIAPPRGPSVTATPIIPDAFRAPPLGLFRFVAASSVRGDEGRADRLTPPRELDDNRLDTAWTEGMAGTGRGAFVTARAIAPAQTVVGIKLVPAAGNRLRSLAIGLGEGSGGTHWLHVALDEAPAGKALYVPLPPSPTGCLTVVLDEVEKRGPADETAIAEISIYTTADAAGVDGLVAQLESGASGADGLARILAEHPREIATALRTAQGASRMRLLRALGGSTKTEAAAPLVAALTTASASERGLVAQSLSPGSPLLPAAREPLLRLVEDRAVPGVARALAIDLLTRGPEKDVGTDKAGQPTSTAALYAALETGHYGDDPLVRAAVLRAMAQAPVEPTIAILLASAPAPSAATPARAATAASAATAAAVTARAAERTEADRVALLGTLAARARAAKQTAAAARAATAIGEAWAPGASFERRFRTLRAARLSAAAGLLPIVEQGSSDSDEIVRWAATQAAGALDGGAGRGVLSRALLDGDPRVRIAALEGLFALHDAALPDAAATALAHDRWPMVQQAAAQTLSSGCPGMAAEALAVAVRSREESVARASLGALGRCDAARAGPLSLKLATDEKVAVGTREQAIVLVAAQKPKGAAHALAEALIDVLGDSRADDRGLGLATSLARGLGRLGDPEALRPLLQAAAEPLSPALRAAAIEALGSYCTPDAITAMTTASTDSEGSVRRASTLALAHCKSSR